MYVGMFPNFFEYHLTACANTILKYVTFHFITELAKMSVSRRKIDARREGLLKKQEDAEANRKYDACPALITVTCTVYYTLLLRDADLLTRLQLLHCDGKS